MKAYQLQMSILSNMQELDENQQLDLKEKALGQTEKHIPLTQEEVQMLSVRRMLPSEYESLQGFPKNWTLVDTERWEMP
jgi:hypothetical protein